jgi:hypothetical protein
MKKLLGLIGLAMLIKYWRELLQLVIFFMALGGAITIYFLHSLNILKW